MGRQYVAFGDQVDDSGSEDFFALGSQLSESAGSTGITGTLSVTEGNDTLAATGALAIAGALAVTEANDTLAATGANAIVGTLSVTEGDDTLSATGTIGSGSITGTLDVTEGNDTLAAAGAVAIAGTLSVTEGNDTAAGAEAPASVATGGIGRKPRRIAGRLAPRVRFEPPPPAMLLCEARIKEGDDTLVATAIVGESPRQRRARQALKFMTM